MGWLVSLGFRFVIRFAFGGALAGPLDRLLGPGLGPLDFGLKSGLLLVALGAGLWIGSLGLGLVAWASVRNLVCPWWRFSRALVWSPGLRFEFGFALGGALVGLGIWLLGLGLRFEIGLARGGASVGLWFGRSVLGWVAWGGLRLAARWSDHGLVPCPCARASVCLCVRARVSVRPGVRASVCPCVRVSVCPYVRAPVRPCVRASVRPCVRVPVCPYVRAPARPRVNAFHLSNKHATPTCLFGS